MRQLGVKRLIASCLNDACRHTALIDVSSHSLETEIPYFSRKVDVLIKTQTMEGPLSGANRIYCAHSEPFRLCSNS
jgi:hypothetical protein